LERSAVFEILCSKRIKATSLAYMLSFDSP